MRFTEAVFRHASSGRRSDFSVLARAADCIDLGGVKNTSTDGPERERIVRAIREIERAVTEAHREGKRAAAESATREALARCGVDQQTYRKAIEDDPDLAFLERAALREAAGDTPDPGPASISREAPTGQPGDLSATAGENVVNPGDPGPPVLRPPRSPRT